MNNLKQNGLGMLVYANDYGGYLYPRPAGTGNPCYRGEDPRYPWGWLVTYIWLGRYGSAGTYSCPSNPVNATAMAAMEDWQSGVDNSASLSIRYPFWNCTATLTGAESHWPDIYEDTDPKNGEYPMRVGIGKDPTIIIMNDQVQASGGVLRAEYANHQDAAFLGLGSNTLYLDGHVKWKNVDDMEALDGPGQGDSFWW